MRLGTYPIQPTPTIIHRRSHRTTTAAGRRKGTLRQTYIYTYTRTSQGDQPFPQWPAPPSAPLWKGPFPPHSTEKEQKEGPHLVPFCRASSDQVNGRERSLSGIASSDPRRVHLGASGSVVVGCISGGSGPLSHPPPLYLAPSSRPYTHVHTVTGQIFFSLTIN